MILALANLMLVQQPIKSRPRDTQHLRCNAQIVTVTIEHIAQRLALSPGFVILQRAHWRNHGMVADQPQVAGFDLPTFGQHQAATNPIGQFAHIARPSCLPIAISASSLKLRGLRPVSWL